VGESSAGIDDDRCWVIRWNNNLSHFFLLKASALVKFFADGDTS